MVTMSARRAQVRTPSSRRAIARAGCTSAAPPGNSRSLMTSTSRSTVGDGAGRSPDADDRFIGEGFAVRAGLASPAARSAGAERPAGDDRVAGVLGEGDRADALPGRIEGDVGGA